MAIDVLGAVIQKVTVQPLPQAVAELALDPLDMRDTGFSVVDASRLVAHYADGKPEPRRMADDDHVDFFGRRVRSGQRLPLQSQHRAFAWSYVG